MNEWSRLRGRGLFFALALLLMGCPQSSDDDAVNGSVPVEGSGSVDSAPTSAPGADEAVEPAVDDGSGSAAEELAEAAPSTVPTPADSSVLAQGAELYVEYCAFCHGTDGEGYAADNATSLRSQTFLTTAGDSFLNAAIVNGRPGTPMSGWGVERGGPLDASQVETLVAFIRQWQTEPTVELSDAPLAGAAGRGRGPYNAFCARCHANDGSGAGAVSLSNPWLLHTASDEYLRYAILQGRDGTEMRDYSDRVSEALANDIVALIRSWQHPVDQAPPPPYEADFDNARLNPDGADPSFELREERFVSIHAVAQALEAGESLVLLDARPNSDFSISHIEGSLNVPFYDVSKYAGDLPRDAWIVAYCGCPHAVSGRAVDALIAEGFTRVAVLDEGFYDWEEAGYSVARAEP